MPYRDDDDETAGAESDEMDDREMPDASDTDDSDEPGVVPCPYCVKEISEDAQVCPHCGNFISFEDAPPPRRPWYVLLGIGASLLAAVAMALMILR